MSKILSKIGKAEKKELLERKIGGKKSKIGSALLCTESVATEKFIVPCMSVTMKTAVPEVVSGAFQLCAKSVVLFCLVCFGCVTLHAC